MGHASWQTYADIITPNQSFHLKILGAARGALMVFNVSTCFWYTVDCTYCAAHVFLAGSHDPEIS